MKKLIIVWMIVVSIVALLWIIQDQLPGDIKVLKELFYASLIIFSLFGISLIYYCVVTLYEMYPKLFSLIVGLIVLIGASVVSFKINPVDTWKCALGFIGIFIAGLFIFTLYKLKELLKERFFIKEPEELS